MKNRLFIALDLPDDALRYLLEIRKNLAEGYFINWEADDKLHLTLKFIGDFDSELIQDLSMELSFLEGYSSINFQFNNFGFFYRDEKPSILWAGLEMDESLIEIVTQINNSLKKFATPVEYRKFKPHITLLRIKGNIDTGFVNKFKNFTFEPAKFSAETITLYKSILSKQGSKYFKIINYKLK